MTLYFENSRGVWRPIADCANKIDVAIAINKFLDEHNYKSYYTRTWDKDGWRHYDVGSWSEFFHWQISSNPKFPKGVFDVKFDALWDEAVEWAELRAREEGDVDINTDYEILEKWEEQRFIELCESEGLDYHMSQYVKE